MRKARRALILAPLALVAAACATTSARLDKAAARIETAVASASRACGCRLGVAARHLESGRAYEHEADKEFEAASVIKIAVITEAIARVRDGEIDLSQRWTLSEAEKADGSGTLLLLDPGLNPTWNDLLTLMIGPSDNTATNAWIERLGIDRINARMAALGLPEIRLLATLPSYSARTAEPSPWAGFRLGTITARAVADWMGRVARGELLDAEASRLVFEYLDRDPSRLRIARRFPAADLWAGKTGSMRGVRNDSGILRTRKGRFVLVVLTDGSRSDSASAADHPAVLAIASVARAIVDAWSDLPDVVEKPK